MGKSQNIDAHLLAAGHSLEAATAATGNEMHRIWRSQHHAEGCMSHLC